MHRVSSFALAFALTTSSALADAPLVSALGLDATQARQVDTLQASHRKAFAAKRQAFNRESRALRRARIAHDATETARLESSIEAMRADLTRIWQAEQKTILFVTHDIEEAVQLADRVLVMSQRPATIQTVVPVNLARPRDLDSRGYLATRDSIFAAMGMSLRIGENAPGEEPSPAKRT